MIDDLLQQIRRHPHDAFVKYLLSETGSLGRVLQGLLPAGVIEVLDLQTLHLIPTETVDRQLGRRHADVMASVLTSTGGPCRVLVLNENQRRPDPLMAWRCLDKLARRWNQEARQDPEEVQRGRWRPPPVIVVVLYNGSRPWSFSVELPVLLCGQAPQLKSLQHLQPTLPIRLLDLHRTADGALPGGPAERLALLALKHVGSPQLWDHVLRWKELWKSAMQIRGADFVHAVLSYLGYAGQRRPSRRLRQLLPTLADTDNQEIVMGWLHQMEEEWLQEGIQKGLVKGRQEGRQEGRLDGQRQMLRRVLRRRFGPLPPQLGELVDTATAPLLTRWLDRSLEAADLAEVFKDG